MRLPRHRTKLIIVRMEDLRRLRCLKHMPWGSHREENFGPLPDYRISERKTKDRDLEESPIVVARDEAADVKLVPFVIAAIAYLAIVTAVVDFTQEISMDEDIGIFLVGALLAPLALVSILPPAPEKSRLRTFGVAIAGSVGGAGAGAAVGGAAAGAFSGGLLAPVGALIGAGVGVLFGGGAGLASTRSGKKSCIYCDEKHSQTEYICPNTKKYNLRAADLKIPSDYWFSEDDARIYLGVNFDLTVNEAGEAAMRIFEYASKDTKRRKSVLGSRTRIFHDDFLDLVGHKDWLAGEDHA